MIISTLGNPTVSMPMHFEEKQILKSLSHFSYNICGEKCKIEITIENQDYTDNFRKEPSKTYRNAK